MTVNELIKELQEQVEKGYGDKPIYTEGDNGTNMDIDSIQKNTHSKVEPEYLFIMNGGYSEHNHI